MKVTLWAVTAALVAGLATHVGVPQPHPVVGVQASPVGTPVDILPYWTNGTGYELTGTHPLATVVQGDQLYRVKFDEPAYWEDWTVPASPSGDFTLNQDTTDPNHRYTFTSPMYPRTMVIGQVYTSQQLSGGAGNLETSYAPVSSGPCVPQFQQQFPFSTELVTKLTNYTGLGGNLGAVTVIDLRYSYGNGSGGTEYEDNWNALGYGLVQWQLWHYDSSGNRVVEQTSTFNETTTTPMTQPDLSAGC